jgi:hypothetical protein
MMHLRNMVSAEITDEVLAEIQSMAEDILATATGLLMSLPLRKLDEFMLEQDHPLLVAEETRLQLRHTKKPRTGCKWVANYKQLYDAAGVPFKEDVYDEDNYGCCNPFYDSLTSQHRAGLSFLGRVRPIAVDVHDACDLSQALPNFLQIHRGRVGCISPGGEWWSPRFQRKFLGCLEVRDSRRELQSLPGGPLLQQ